MGTINPNGAHHITIGYELFAMSTFLIMRLIVPQVYAITVNTRTNPPPNTEYPEARIQYPIPTIPNTQ